MNIQKNQEYIVEIIDNGFEGEGIAKIDNFTIFIPGTIKGEKVKILIVKVLSSHAFGKIVEILEKSDVRQEVDCTTYKRCGGCNMRHIKYEDTLKIKQNAVQSLVNKTLKNKIQVKPTLGMENPLHYRNKAQYPIGINKNGEPVIGVFANRTHEVIPMEKCLIQNPISEEIAKTVLFQIIAGEMEPDEGELIWGTTITKSYFPKDNAYLFNSNESITDWLRQYSKDPDETYVRGFLGRMLFSGDEALKQVRVLSGGEKVRCVLSKMMLSGANFLIFDEPTNHLDMESITSVNEGMKKFTGNILFTSHDHELTQTVANRIIDIKEDGRVIDREVTYNEYLGIE